jgi:hypothetical protein
MQPMRLDYRGGILFFIGVIVAKYIEDILPPLGSIIKYLLIDWIWILLGSMAISIVLYDIIRNWGSPNAVQRQESKTNSLTGYFSRRSELPPFGEMLSIAKNTVDMSGLDFRIIIHQNINVIKSLVHKGVKITFLILDPESSLVSTQAKSLHASSDLKVSIQKTLNILCKEKEKLPEDKRENLNIRICDSAAPRSIIIIDRDDPDNAWLKVEHRPEDSDSDSRPSEAHYRKNDDKGFFSQYSSEYDNLYQKSQDHKCRNIISSLRNSCMYLSK